MTSRQYAKILVFILLFVFGGLISSSLGAAQPKGKCSPWPSCKRTTTTTTTTIPTTTTTPPPPTADAYVSPGGFDVGSCPQSAPCRTFDYPWDLVPAGSTISVAAGTYPSQKVTGDKAAETKIVGESKSSVRLLDSDTDCEPTWGAASTMCVEAANLTLQDVTIDTGHFGNASSAVSVGRINSQDCGGCNPHHVTFRNVDVTGDYPSSYFNAPDFTWIGGTYGPPAGAPPTVCNNGANQPIWIDPGAVRMTIDGLRMTPYRLQVVGGCTPHIEHIRLEGGDDLHVLNSTFLGGGDEGSGHLFAPAGSERVVIEGNTFEAINATFSMQLGGINTWTFRNNFFAQPVWIADGSSPVVACGNSGDVDASWTEPC